MLGASAVIRSRCDVKYWSVGDESKLDRVAAREEHDRNRRRRGLRRLDRKAIRGHDVHPTTNEIGCQFRHSIVPTFRPAIPDCDVASLDVAGFTQALAERAQNGARIASGDSLCRKPILAT